MTTLGLGFSGRMNEISLFRSCLSVFTRLFTDFLCSAVWNASVIVEKKKKDTRQIALSLRNGEGAVIEEGLHPSIAPCPGLEFSLGHSSREAEVSEETPLCPDRLGSQQWLMHNGSTQDRGEVSESISAAADNPFLFSLCFSSVSDLFLCHCQEAVSPFSVWSEW